MLNLTKNEQNALAMLAEICGSVQYKTRQWEDAVNINEQLRLQNEIMKKVEDVITVVDSFPNMRWDQLYDKLHRTGANA